MTAITGLILAGGLGRRMGGVDKGLQLFQGRPLVAHVIERLGTQVDRLLINANRNRAIYTCFGPPLVADTIEGYAGPLAGLHAGLLACRTPLLAMAPCDAPRLPPDLVARLHAALDLAGTQIAVAWTAGQMQPVFLLCRQEVISALTDFLATGGRSVTAWASSLAATRVDFPDAGAFVNINTLDELHAGEAPQER